MEKIFAELFIYFTIFEFCKSQKLEFPTCIRLCVMYLLYMLLLVWSRLGSSLVQPLSPVAILYNYDHCPFCVRVRFALGVKGVKHNLNFLANDDVLTPTALVGKKIAPIFEYELDGVKVSE